MIFSVETSPKLNKKQIRDLVYKLNFIHGIQVVKDQESITVTCDNGINVDEMKKRVDTITSEIKDDLQSSKTIFKSVANDSLYQEDVYHELLLGRAIKSYGGGVTSFGKMYSGLMDYFDHLFVQFADILKAEKHTYSTLMPVEILEQCNYIDSFPQYVNFVTHIEDDHDLIGSFRENWSKRSSGGFSLDTFFKKTDYMLSPAVCFHCYKMLEDNNISQEKGKVITAKGKCFRYESKNMRTLERLRDFTMREIISIGDSEVVQRNRTEAIRYISDIINKLGMVGHIEVANDPFFTEDAARKKSYQLKFELKYEIRLLIPYEGKTIAVGSFNIHEDYFGRVFNIRLAKDQYASTGCSAFGIERWVFAFLAQFGPHHENWPREVREYLDEKLAN